MTNRLKNISLPFQLISTYRAELMGFAILGVLCGHLMNVTYQPIVLAQIARLLHTAGFIFLSGFGLYYAYTKNSDIKSFYKKRFTRIVIPFVLLTYWFFVITLIDGIDTPLRFFTNITTLSFWLYGNVWAMWYVSVTLFLYLIFPLLYNFIFTKRNPAINLAILIVIYAISLLILAFCVPEYWELTKLGYARMILFPIGMYVGYLSKESKKITLLQLFGYFIICGVLLVISKLWLDDEIFAVMRTLFGIPLVVLFFQCMHNIRFANYIIFTPLAFMGKYSYEIYLIHMMIFYFFHHIVHLDFAYSMIIGITIALLICQPTNKGIQHIMGKLQK